MSEDPATGGAEARAEEIVERLVSDGFRWLSRVAGRVREEIEDIVAEGRDLHRGGGAGHGSDDAGAA